MNPWSIVITAIALAQCGKSQSNLTFRKIPFEVHGTAFFKGKRNTTSKFFYLPGSYQGSKEDDARIDSAAQDFFRKADQEFDIQLWFYDAYPVTVEGLDERAKVEPGKPLRKN